MEKDAVAAILAAGLTLGATTEALSETVRFEKVITQFPVAGTAVEPGTAVDLEISTGKSAETVRRVIQDVQVEDTILPEEIATDAGGRNLARTRLTIVYYLTATETEINDLLASQGATVIQSLKGTRSMVVRIPDPGTLAAYNQIVAAIEAESFVQFVMDSTFTQVTVLPDNYSAAPPDLAELDYIDHHLAVNAAPAWNARGAIVDVPQVLVADYFGAGPPLNNSIDYIGGLLPGVSDFEYDLLNPHGYMVLSVIAGSFGQYYPTGMLPGTIQLRVHDGTASPDWGATMHNLLWMLRDEIPGNVVINSSIAYGCDGTGGDCVDIDEARQDASLWIEYVDWFDLEGRVLHITAANNIKDPPGTDIRDARTASPFAAARLLDGLTDSLGNPLPNLSNTLVVENVFNDFISEDIPTVPYCLSNRSFVNGDISAIGTDVWVFSDNTGGTYSEVSGTSFSAPQVAGLAAYCWAIAPNLTPQEIISVLYTNSETLPGTPGSGGCSDWPDPAPVINAYTTLLSLDTTAALDPEHAPVLHALMDVNEDDVFNQDDLALFVTAYFGSTLPDATLQEPDVMDYSRYDINGDGWTGGINTSPFDLDRSTSVQYGPILYDDAVTQDIAGTEITYDENVVTDLDALCYCAYSGLYKGSPQERDTLLKKRCAPMMRVFAGVNGGEDPSAQEQTGFAAAYSLLHITGDNPVYEFGYNHGGGWLPDFDVSNPHFFNYSSYEIDAGTSGGGGAGVSGASASSSYDFDGETLSISASTASVGTDDVPIPTVQGTVAFKFVIEINNTTTSDMILEVSHSRTISGDGAGDIIHFFDIWRNQSASTEQIYFYDIYGPNAAQLYRNSSGSMDITIPPGVSQILQDIWCRSKSTREDSSTSFTLEYSIATSK